MEVVVLGLVGAITLVVGLVYGDRYAIRKLRKARSFAIGELAEGKRGRLIGEAFPLGDTLRAPLTGRSCVYYIAVVEERGQVAQTMKPVVKEVRSVPFVLTDGTGRAVVDPAGAEIALDFDSRTTSGTFDAATPVEAGFLERHGKSPHGPLFKRSLIYREAVIHVGERIAVLGEGVREPDPDAAPADDYRGAPPTRLRLASTRRFPLVISDSPDATRPKP